jgi:coenzyme F420-dependent glucose-6-phosphate dehydrogenase
VIAAYRRSCEESSREAGEIILQVPVSWAESDDEALAGAREWKATLVDEHYTEPIHEPGKIQANGQEISDTKFKAMSVISSDPGTHLTKIKALEQLGPTAMVFMNISGADPLGTLRVYGQEILPRLRSE